MSGGDFLSEGKSTLDFIVQTGVLLGFIGAFAGFLYRFVKSQLHRTIAEKIAPVEQKVDKALNKLDEIKIDTIKEIKVKEEIDRERFRNIHNGQEHIKEQLKESIQNTEETKKKLDIHLVEAATFVGKTDAKIGSMENALNNFRRFMRHAEDNNQNNDNV